MVFGVELQIEGQWVLVEMPTREMMEHLFRRACELGHYPARRVMLIEYGTLLLDT